MRSLFYSFLGYFLTIPGVMVMAAHYGRGILGWMRSTTFEVIVGVLIVLAVVGTLVSAVAVWRSTHTSHAGDQEALVVCDRPPDLERIRAGSAAAPRRLRTARAAPRPR